MGPNRLVMYAATAFELGSTGLGSGAFGVLLLRLTQKRFSATQYALLSSLFTLPRILAGPVAGVLADAIGWRDFFVFTIVIGIPGMVMLARFVPWGVRDVEFEVRAPARGPPLGRGGLAARGRRGARRLAVGLGGVGLVAGCPRCARTGFAALPRRGGAAPGTDRGVDDRRIGLVVLAVPGLATAAVLVARRGVASGPRPAEE